MAKIFLFLRCFEANFLITWVWLLGIFGILSLVVGLIANEHHFSFLINKDMFAFAGVIIAAAGLFYNAYVNKCGKIKEESKFYLEKYIKISELILERLHSHKPTRRMAWVTAASFADSLEKFQRKIVNKTDVDFLHVYQRNYAHLIIDFLSNKPAEYFYGIDNAEDLDEAAEKSQPNHGKAIAGLIPQVELFRIDEIQIKSILRSIASVWEREVNYPLSDVKGNINMDVLKFNNTLFPGLYLYVVHKRSRESIFDANKHCCILKRRTI